VPSAPQADTAGTACPACGARALAQWFTKGNVHGSFAVQRCPGCRSAFGQPRPSQETIRAFYSQCGGRTDARLAADDPAELLRMALAEERRFPDLTFDARRYVRVLNRLGASGELLDVGCGIGIHASVAKEAGFRVHGIEPGRAACSAYALLNGSEPHQGMLTDEFARDHANAFDVVLLSQVLEHVCDLDAMVRWLRAMLREGGILAVGIPRFRSWLSVLQGTRDMFISPPEHVNFFTTAGLRQLFLRAGFELVASETLSRIDPARIQRRLPLGIFRASLARLIAAGFRATDLRGCGISLRQYFRKQAGQ